MTATADALDRRTPQEKADAQIALAKAHAEWCPVCGPKVTR